MHLRFPPSSALLVCLALLVGSSSKAHADQADTVARLLAAGQATQALERADKFLQVNPNDAAMRFQRGVILNDLGRTAEAIDAFERLTEDFPDLPEPYNNLAVLLSTRGEYEQARAALETAIRNNPDYAVAHENLGDVLVALAARSYARAMKLDPDGTTAAPKLALARELLARSLAARRSASAIRAPSS